MPTIPFSQFLRRYGIMLFFAAEDRFRPGAIIEKRRRGLFYATHVQNVLGGGAAKWATEFGPGNLVYGTVHRTLSLRGKASLNEFGVNITGGLQRARSVTFDVTGVKVRRFKSQDKITIVPQLHQLRASNKRLWRMVNDNLLADITYYATDITVKFETSGSVNLKGAIAEQIELPVDAGIRWKGNKSFIISKNDKIPFGFSGWRI